MIPVVREVREAAGPPVRLGPGTALDAGPGAGDVARLLRADLGAATGLPLLPSPAGAAARPAADEGEAGDGDVALRLDPSLEAELGPESYRLTVGPEAPNGGVDIAGATPAGLFWGTQTLRQLLGPAAYRRARIGTEGPRPLVPGRFTDAPRFGWRGLMLDVARHFTPKEGVLRVIDLMAAHKLNVLQFHLTDDQGWRIEINRYPRLTEVGAWRPRSRAGHRASPHWDERPHGGYYTQDDLREIVAYATDRHITVIPEINIPGHSQAAIAAYPELGNADAVDTEAIEVWTDWGISEHALAPSDTVLRFYEHVLEEVLEIFPSRYVHMGGDECRRDEWRASPAAAERMRAEGLADEDQLQSWIMRHFDRWLTARGRHLVGWDEILQGGLAEGATVSSWRGYAGGIAAAEAGHDVVMCPEQQVYLDHRQDGGADEPVPIGFVRTLRDVYLFEPVPPRLAGTPHERRVLGTQANMWTECTETPQRIDYQLFPRLAAFAEVAWSELPAPGDRDPAHFEQRMASAHYARLDALGVNYRPPAGPHPWQRRPGLLGRPLDGPPPAV
ncbi:beta-N-acetylhexosaminidase [Streptomyces sp. AJS327]|nr:beta-N-acetylhexosaminidase [Streptomyces sp. AJS327]